MSKSRDIGDSAATINFIDNLTSDAQTQLNTLTTNVATNATAISNINVTSGSQTKTYSAGETSTITLSGNVLSPIIGVTKEVAQTGTTNNAWDVNSSSENYTRYNSAPATTLDFSADDDVSAATETSITLSGASQSTSLLGGTIGNAGQNAYMLDQTSGIIYQYLLSTAYDLSSGSYESKTFDVSSQQSDPRNLFFKSDGTKLYVIGTTSQAIYQYSLSTAWDISTASYDSKTFSASSQSTGTSGLFIKPDGTKLYIVAYGNDAVYQYSLSTAWDISTASYDSVSLSVSSQDSTPRDITFNDDGTVLYMCGTGNNALYQYNLTTAYDLSSASYSSNTLSFSTTVFSVTYSSASLQLVIFQSLTDILKTVRLGNTLTLGTGSFASADVGKTIEANSGVFILTSTAGAYSETTAPTSFAQVASGSWEMYAVVFNTTDGDLELSSLDNTFNISTASFVDSFSVNSQETGPQDVTFNSDGTKMFVIGFSSDAVQEYHLSTGFDVSTASHDSSFSVSSQETAPRAIAFNPAGTKMFVAGTSGNDVNEYTLSTGFDVSTASFVDSFSISGNVSAVSGIAFSTDGTKMFATGTTDDVIAQYTLTTGFDVSTASFTRELDISSYDGSPRGLTFNGDGTKMFFTGNSGRDVNEFALTTGFDVTSSNVTHVRTFDVSGQDTDPKGLAFNSSGTKMFVVGDSGNDINEYTLSGAVAPSGYHAAHTTTSTDSTYWTDINSMTADEAAGDGAIYYCVSTDDRTTWKIAKGTDGERSIVRNNSGTWQYNSNGTYGSTTWANATTNAELAAIQEAMGTAANQMNKTQLDAIPDANHFTLADDLDLAIIFNMSSGATAPSSDGVAINYDANVLNQGAILGTDYTYDAPAQNKVRITSTNAANLKVRIV
jgi:6-phosphogluconolactonase (cycloisomerase 2 family)